MKMHIRLINGIWLVNNKELSELNEKERAFMDGFFTGTKFKHPKYEDQGV